MSITDLPDLVMLKVFSYLDHQDLVFAIRSTCQSWNYLSFDESLWKVFVLDDFRTRLSDEEFLNLLRTVADHVEKIDFNVFGVLDERHAPPPSKMMTKSSYLHEGIHCKKLKHIVFQKHLMQSGLDPSCVRDIVLKYPDLETFDAKQVHTQDLDGIILQLCKLKSLKSIHLHDYRLDGVEKENLFNENISKLFQNCKYLEEVDITCFNIWDSTIICLLTTCKSLHSLSFNDCPEVDLMCFECTKFSSLNLTSLDISMTAVDMKGLECIAKKCPNLKTICMDGCRIFDPGFVTLAENCKELESIVVCSGEVPGVQGFIGKRGLKSLGKHCPELRTLEMQFCSMVNDSGLSALVVGCPKLKKLCLLSCHMVTDVAVNAISEHCKDMNYLDLSHCFLITSSSVTKLLASHLPLNTLKLEGCASLEATPGGLSLEDGLQPRNPQTYCHLSDLDMTICGRVNTDVLRAIALNCPDLKHLSLNGCNSVIDSDMEFLVEKCPVLDSIEISAGADERLEELEYFVKSIRFDKIVPKLGDQTLFAVAKHCTNLRSITIEQNPNITLAGLRDVLENCAMLKWLCFSVGKKYSLTMPSLIAMTESFQKRKVDIYDRPADKAKNGDVRLYIGEMV